jgi:GNAT superfamily N-acetyltransferase
MIKYSEDTFENVMMDFMTLLPEHMAEMNWFQRNGAKFDPDYAAYIRGQNQGKFLLVTAKDSGVLVGYIVFFVDLPVRFKSTIYAKEDLYYVVPEYRRQGIAKRLFEEAEILLKEYNVDFMLATTKTYLDRSGLLEQAGFECYEKVFGKKIKE